MKNINVKPSRVSIYTWREVCWLKGEAMLGVGQDFCPAAFGFEELGARSEERATGYGTVDEFRESLSNSENDAADNPSPIDLDAMAYGTPPTVYERRELRAEFVASRRRGELNWQRGYDGGWASGWFAGLFFGLSMMALAAIAWAEFGS